MKWLLIDGIGPFFPPRAAGKRVNWSKIPFHRIERDEVLDPALFLQIRADFQKLAATAAQMGFNAITLDDVAHLAIHPDYPAEVRRKIDSYRAAYTCLCADAAAAGLRVFLTTDVMFAHASVQRKLRSLRRDAIPFLAEACDQILDLFPQVAGIIARLGECDGVDVEAAFPSRLAIKTPRDARNLIDGLLPTFVRRERLLVLRTWTVGAYPIGDLMWHRKTFDQTFEGVDSPHFAISMKYGETDFFRFLPLNKLFFRSRHQKFIELQARREYEGFGAYPSFVGWDYEAYLRELATATNVIGGWVWCQTGGWGRFQNITFLRDSSVWNEINTFVTARLLKTGCTTESAVAQYCHERLPGAHEDQLLSLLRLSDEVIRELLYIDEFARRKLFFRRLRVPPLLAVYWDRILVNHGMRTLLRCFVQDGEQTIRQGHAALQKIRAMEAIAESLGLPAGDLRFQYDTFEIIAAVREFFFGPADADVLERLTALKSRYKATYAVRYAVKMDLARFGVPHTRVRLLLRIMLRHQRGYRLLDRLVLIRLLAWLGPLLRLREKTMLPSFARKQAMGLHAVLR